MAKFVFSLSPEQADRLRGQVLKALARRGFEVSQTIDFGRGSDVTDNSRVRVEISGTPEAIRLWTELAEVRDPDQLQELESVLRAAEMQGE